MDILELEDAPIRIDAQGKWYHGLHRLHPRVEKLFEEHIEINAEGIYEIHVGTSRAPLYVEDCAFFVRALDFNFEEGRLIDVLVGISDHTQEKLDPCTLMQDENHVFYCRLLRSGWKAPCRFLPKHYHQLFLQADFHAATAEITIGNKDYPIAPYTSKPQKIGK
jgi:hypothetical protein